MQNIAGKLFGGLVVILLGSLLYFTVFSDGLGKAPAVQITAPDGQVIHLEKPLKPVLVNFWATSCPGCISEMPEMAKMKQALGDRFEIVAISMDYDPKEQVEKFVQANPYPFIFTMDTDGSMSKAFGDIKLTPTSFLIAPNGNIVYQKIGIIDFEPVTERIKQMSPQL